MKKKTLIISLAVLLSFVLAGVSIAQEYEGPVQSEYEGPPVQLDNSTGGPSDYRVDPDANWLALARAPYEADLEDTYEYQNNPEQFIHVKEDQVWAGAKMPEGLVNPCLVAELIGTSPCLENMGG